MRKPRDFDSELKEICERAKALQERKLRQLGELVVATGADSLQIEQLAGALIAAMEADDGAKEAWRRRGATFFQRSRRSSGGAASASPGGAHAGGGGAPPPAGQEVA